jgi:hypothetical protein
VGAEAVEHDPAGRATRQVGEVGLGGGWVGGGAGAALGVGDVEGGVGEEFGVPAGLVEQMVVPAAEQHEARQAL